METRNNSKWRMPGWKGSSVLLVKGKMVFLVNDYGEQKRSALFPLVTHLSEAIKSGRIISA